MATFSPSNELLAPVFPPSCSTGGAERISAQIQAWKTEAQALGNEYSLIHAGDGMTGTAYYSFYGPAPDAAYMNAVGFDIFVVGNHEFDDGDARLANFTRFLNMPVISYNCKCFLTESFFLLFDLGQ